jgi:hypothetical protein
VSKVVTIACPLPKWLPYEASVAEKIQKNIEVMRKFSADRGVTTYQENYRCLQVAHGHNELAKNVKGEWILIFGSDHTVAPDALMKLLTATEEDPEIKIIMGTTNHRELPNRPVAYNFDSTGERLLAIVPFRDFHPGEAEAGAVIKVDVVGTGCTLIHRDAFTTIPFPWFEFGAQPIRPQLLEPLFDWKKMLDIPTMSKKGLQKYSKELADAAQRAKVRYRWPLTHGPDMNFCLKAKHYGFQCHLHLGVIVRHYTWVGVGMEHYVEYLKQGGIQAFEQEFFGGKEPTVEGVQEARKLVDDMREAQKKAEAEFEAEMRKRLVEKGEEVAVSA